MIFGSVCSGIEAASQAWHPLGWRAAFYSEIDKFPSAVLAHHYGSNMPGGSLSRNGTPNLGDMTKFEEWPDYAIDLLVGGTPCQDYSIAGKRLGMAGDRGQLTLTYIEIAARFRPRWIVWENVLGVLSSNDGRDFARFLGDLSGTVIDVPENGWPNAGIIPGISQAYGIAYRVLDTQYARTCDFPRAIPQRRRRVFVVGYIGDWRCAAAVLFDAESLRWNPPPRRETGKGTAPAIGARPTGGGGLGADFDLDGGLVANSGDVGYCLTASAQNSLDAETETLIAVAHALRGEGFDASEDGTGRGTPIVPICFNSREDPEVTFDRTGPLSASSPQAQAIAIQERAVSENVDAGPQGAGFNEDGAAYTLEARNKVQAVAFDLAQITSAANRSTVTDVSPTMTKASDSHAVERWAVRRLTPRECDRLQGSADDYTRIPWRGKPAEQCPDGPRYKAQGNGMSANVLGWLGERIELVDGLVPDMVRAAE
jgi:DNA (cytosine-5)-methyltransferase 1